MEWAKAAFRLVNEWRDTIFYTIALAVVLSGAFSAGHAVGWFLTMCSLREVSRAVAWTFSDAVLVGESRIDDRLMYAASTVIGNSAIAVVMFADLTTFQTVLGLINATIAAVRLHEAGGARTIAVSYRDVMWDFPRKQGGGGQTKKLTDSLKAMLHLEPAPSAAR